MKLERIFSELDSRDFIVLISGHKRTLPNLNKYKKEIALIYSETVDKEGNLSVQDFQFAILNRLLDKKLATEIKSLKYREMNELFSAWWKWSNVEFSKYLKVLALVEKFTSGIELDLLARGLNFESFFSLSMRTQLSIIESLASEHGSHLNTERNEYSYRWSLLEEMNAQLLEFFVQANRDPDKGGKPYSVPRPWDEVKKKKDKIDITDEMRRKAQARLNPIF